MAGIKTSYVDPDAAGTGSGDDWTNAYTSLSAAISDNVAGTGQLTSADLVTNTENWVVNCRSSSGTADTTLATINGFTTDATYDITINGDNTTGKYNTSAYRIEYTASANFQRGVRVQDDYVTVNDLQVSVTNTGNYTDVFCYQSNPTGAASALFNRCIARCASLNGTGEAVGFHIQAATHAAWNCLAYDFIGSTGTDVFGFWGTGDTFNCTAYNCKTGFRHTAMLAKNCVAMSCTDGFLGGFEAGSNYNASDIASDAPGANSNNGTAATFIDATNANFQLDPADTVAYDTGDDLSGTFTDDITGFTRVLWSMGAFDGMQISSVSGDDVVGTAENPWSIVGTGFGSD